MRGSYRVEVYLMPHNQWFDQGCYNYEGNALKQAEEWAYHYRIKTRVVDVRGKITVKEFDGRCN